MLAVRHVPLAMLTPLTPDPMVARDRKFARGEYARPSPAQREPSVQAAGTAKVNPMTIRPASQPQGEIARWPDCMKDKGWPTTPGWPWYKEPRIPYSATWCHWHACYGEGTSPYTRLGRLGGQLSHCGLKGRH